MKILQLFEWYPVLGGCPHEECGKDLVGTPSQQQRTGASNLQITNCPYCGGGLELVICKELAHKKLKPDLKGRVMKATKSESIVLVPGTRLDSKA